MKWRNPFPHTLVSRLPHWTTVLVVVLVIWSLPRLLPHVKALVGMRMQNAAHPQYAVRTLDGRLITQDSLRGRVVLVNVWATWCLPCRVEMPLMESTWRRHREAGLVILGASVDRGSAQNVQEFVSSRDITYPIAIVDAGFIAAIGGVIGYPTSILIGRDGTVQHKVIGPIGPVSLEPAIRRALADTVPGDATGAGAGAGAGAATGAKMDSNGPVVQSVHSERWEVRP